MNLADNVSLRSDVLVCNRQYAWVDVLFIGESIDMTSPLEALKRN